MSLVGVVEGRRRRTRNVESVDVGGSVESPQRTRRDATNCELDTTICCSLASRASVAQPCGQCSCLPIANDHLRDGRLIRRAAGTCCWGGRVASCWPIRCNSIQSADVDTVRAAR